MLFRLGWRHRRFDVLVEVCHKAVRVPTAGVGSDDVKDIVGRIHRLRREPSMLTLFFNLFLLIVGIG